MFSSLFSFLLNSSACFSLANLSGNSIISRLTPFLFKIQLFCPFVAPLKVISPPSPPCCLLCKIFVMVFSGFTMMCLVWVSFCYFLAWGVQSFLNCGLSLISFGNFSDIFQILLLIFLCLLRDSNSLDVKTFHCLKFDTLLCYPSFFPHLCVRLNIFYSSVFQLIYHFC